MSRALRLGRGVAARHLAYLRSQTYLQRAPIAALTQAQVAGGLARKPAHFLSVPHRTFAENTAEEPINPTVVEPAAAKVEELSADTETIVGEPETHVFQAETKQLLDIVARSLYTDTEVFIRELVSNASDALEKLRYHQISEGGGDGEALQIRVFCDEAKNTITIQDTGIGMTDKELSENLGTIAHSGSKAFLKALSEQGKSGVDNLIGQFGVGFYSSFMVSDMVKVFTRSATSEQGWCWSSSGDGRFSMCKADGVAVGTKIQIHLKDGFKQFSDKRNVRSILKKYSNFVGFPIVLNGEPTNTIGALWTKTPSTVTDQEHTEFYRFISHGFDEPQYKLMYSTDAPISIRSVFYIPSYHHEHFVSGQQKCEVGIYSKRVLIKASSDNVLPPWCRFVKGVVDCEDIPLNVSREHMQDSALIRKLGGVVSKRIVKWLQDEAKKDLDKYDQFYKDFGMFIKEGVCSDIANQSALSHLLRFETSATEPGKTCFLSDYVARAKEGQNKIYFMSTSGRDSAEQSPYYEAFKKAGIEVLFLTAPVDEIVCSNLGKFDKFDIVSVEQSEPPKQAETEEDKAAEDKAKEGESDSKPLSDDEAVAICDWLGKDVLADSASAVKVTKRLVSHPAVIVGHQPLIVRQMMKMSSPTSHDPAQGKKYEMHINPAHPLIVGLHKAMVERPDVAKVVAEQMFSNACLAAGVLDDTRPLASKFNAVLALALDAPKA